MNGAELIAAERLRQVSEEGWSPLHDDQTHDRGELARAAAVYAIPAEHRDIGSDLGDRVPEGFPWAEPWWKPTPEDRVRELIKAGALIAAEIDRLQRTEQVGGGQGGR